MKEIILKYLEYLERKRKSRDLWRLVQEESYTQKAALEVFKESISQEQKDYALECLQDYYIRVDKLKNQIKHIT